MPFAVRLPVDRVTFVGQRHGYRFLAPDAATEPRQLVAAQHFLANVAERPPRTVRRLGDLVPHPQTPFLTQAAEFLPGQRAFDAAFTPDVIHVRSSDPRLPGLHARRPHGVGPAPTPVCQPERRGCEPAGTREHTGRVVRPPKPSRSVAGFSAAPMRE